MLIAHIRVCSLIHNICWIIEYNDITHICGKIIKRKTVDIQNVVNLP